MDSGCADEVIPDFFAHQAYPPQGKSISVFAADHLRLRHLHSVDIDIGTVEAVEQDYPIHFLFIKSSKQVGQGGICASDLQTERNIDRFSSGTTN